MCWKWHSRNGAKQLQNGGLDLGDGGIPLLALRFADDILLFATSRVEGTRMVDALVTCLKEVGLALNASKPRIPTTQAQSGKTVTTQNGLEMEFWMRLRRTNGLDACYQLSTLATQKLTWTSVRRRRQRFSMRTNGFCVTIMFPSTLISNFFDSVVTSVVRFGTGQRKLYTSELRKLDVHCRKFLR